jgi:hypothetical protein
MNQMPRLVLFALLTSIALHPALGVETVRFRDGSAERCAVGEILLEAQDGGLMLHTDGGRIWTLQPKQILARKSDETELAPIDADEMQRRMLKELPGGFKVYRTQHYLVVYNSNEAHAKRVAALFEQLYKNFFAFWKNSRWDFPKPRFPLVALVLRDHNAFLEHAGAEIGDTSKSVIGYYHLGSNRMTTFNVPNWERNVATIIHEATHQLAYNCGLQRRFADNPMWVSEGLATFFEAPDRNNPGKWRRIGRVNQVKLRDWNKYVGKRPAESLTTLLSDDARFRSAATGTNAYAEGWALTYFLIKTRRAEYVTYLKTLSEGRPLAERTQRERIDMFETAFATTLVDLDKAFVAYMRRVRIK